MIVHKNDYNPLPAIIAIIPENRLELTTEHLDSIRKELFKAGVVAETDDEFDKLLTILSELKVL